MVDPYILLEQFHEVYPEYYWVGLTEAYNYLESDPYGNPDDFKYFLDHYNG